MESVAQFLDRHGCAYEVMTYLRGACRTYAVRSSDGRVVAEAILRSSGEGVHEVEVDPYLRRRGIATCLYLIMEVREGYTLRPSVTRTRAGVAFWNDRLRA